MTAEGGQALFLRPCKYWSYLFFARGNRPCGSPRQVDGAALDPSMGMHGAAPSHSSANCRDAVRRCGLRVQSMRPRA